MAEVERYGEKLVDVETGEVMPDEGWQEDEAGLPIFTAHGADVAESEWSALEGGEAAGRLKKGAIAAEVSDKAFYGDNPLVKFAVQVGAEYRTIREYRRVHERLAALEIGARAPIVEAVEAGVLPYSQVRVSAPIEWDFAFLALLQRAEEGQVIKTGNGEHKRVPLPVSKVRSKAKPIIARQNRKKVRQLALENPVSEEQAGAYHTIVIDPPWQMEKIGRDERPLQHGFDYPTMSEEQLAEFEPMQTLPAEGCHLYLWTTHKHLPMAFRLAQAWGFNYECLLTWVKNVGFTPFSWMRSTEHVLFCRKGSLDLLRYGERLDFEAKVREHSRKPDEFYELIRRVSPGPRIDVFSREDRPGFDSWGNEAGRFSVA